MAPLVALMLPIFVLMAAMSINIAQMELNRTELRIAADAAVRAGGRTYAETGDISQARAVARDAASRNLVGGQPLQLANSDFEFGVATRPNSSSRYQFDSSGANFNALRLTARRTNGSPSGPIPLLLPNLLGRNHFEPTQIATSTQVELDVAVVVDRSGSMAYADNENSNTYNNPAAAPAGWKFGDPVPVPSRWDDTVAAVSGFLNVLDQTPQQERVSLVTYGDLASIDIDLGTDYRRVMAGMDVYTRNFPEGMTNIGGGIDFGRRSLVTSPNARPWASRVIVVLTDGIHNTGTDPISAARRARDAGATVFTVTFSDEANQSRMKQVARIASGKHYHAKSRDQLIAAFEEIAHSLPTLIVE
jgi:hypothetical protein